MNPIRLLGLVLIAALGWAGWWGWGAWSAKRDLTGWLESRRAAGRQAEWSDISVQGFPTRIDRTITDLTLADTKGGWVLNAPFFQILGLNYQKDHVILIWPDTMSLQTPYETISITGDKLQGSMTFVPKTEREVESATMVFKGLGFSSDAGWTMSVAEARLAARPAPGREGWQDIGLEITNLKPRSEFIERLSEIGIVPRMIERINADLTVRFDRPWDTSAIEANRPQPREIDIQDLGAQWGKLQVRVAGALTVGESGQIDGKIVVKATNWQEILQIANESGKLSPGIADTIESALNLVSGLSGRSDTLDIPVTFENGMTRVGFVPLWPAPFIRIP